MTAAAKIVSETRDEFGRRCITLDLGDDATLALRMHTPATAGYHEVLSLDLPAGRSGDAPAWSFWIPLEGTPVFWSPQTLADIDRLMADLAATKPQLLEALMLLMDEVVSAQAA